jgi:hypothetical protein
VLAAIISALVGFAAMNAKAIVLSLLLLLILFLTARKLRTPRTVKAAEEQALIVTVRLRSGDMGNAEERQRIVALEERLSATIRQSKAGEFDGDEFGNGVCTIYHVWPQRGPTIHGGIADSEKVWCSTGFVRHKALR